MNDTDMLIIQTYKRTPVHFYDPHKAPLLDHYRSADTVHHDALKSSIFFTG